MVIIWNAVLSKKKSLSDFMYFLTGSRTAAFYDLSVTLSSNKLLYQSKKHYLVTCNHVTDGIFS